MSKPLPRFDFDMRAAQREFAAFVELLGEGETQELGEASDILPFFKGHSHLSALIGSCMNARISFPDRLKPEYGILGAHVCDLIVGQQDTGAYCLVEYEDATENSVFKPEKRAGIPEWSSRLSHGFDQIVDWFYDLEGVRQSDLFRTVFGTSRATFSGLLVVGRRGHLDAHSRDRLLFRSQNVEVARCPVSIATYDDLRDMLAKRFLVMG